MLGFLIQTPLNERDIARFSLQEYADGGLDVVVYDLSNIFFPDRKQEISSESLYSFKVKEFNSIFDFIRSYWIDSPEFVVDFLNNNFVYKNYLYRVLSLVVTSIKSNRFVVSVGFIPTYQYWKQKGMFKHPLVYEAARLKEYVLSLPWKFFPPNTYFYAGYNSISQSILSKHTKLVPMHNLDYDLFLESCNNLKNSDFEDDYFVFLDQNHVYHDDRLTRKSEFLFIDSCSYFDQVNSFIKRFSEVTGLKGVVCLHPRAPVSQCRKMYKFPIIEHSTCKSVIGATCVICHDTTSVQYAILSKKPIVLLKTSDFRDPRYQAYQECTKNLDLLSDLLGCPILENCSELKDFTIQEVDKNKYNQYILKHIKTNIDCNLLSWEIIMERIYCNKI